MRAALLVLVSLALLTPSAVAANSEFQDRLIERIASAPDPALAMAALSARQRELVLDGLRVAKVVTEAPQPIPASPPAGTFMVAAGGCWTVTWGASAYSGAGLELWSLKQRIDWCGIGTTITSVQRTRWIEVYVPFWSGTIIQDPTWGGVGQWSYRSFVQADMVFTFLNPWLHMYPWLDMTVTANGGLSGSGGGTY